MSRRYTSREDEDIFSLNVMFSYNYKFWVFYRICDVWYNNASVKDDIELFVKVKGSMQQNEFYKKSGLLFATVVMCGVMMGNAVFAQEEEQVQAQEQTQENDPTRPTSVQVSPVRFDWEMNSGDEKSQRINLKNFSDKPYAVSVYVEDFYVSEDSTNTEFFVPDENHPYKAYDMINWVNTSEKEIVLAPNESRFMDFTVKVPEDAPSGGYYGSVFFQYQEHNVDEGDPNASKLKINTRAGVLLTLAVQGDEPLNKSGELQTFESLKKLYWDAPAMFATKVLNNGNIHYLLTGDIEITRFGKDVAKINVTPKIYYPGRTRMVESKWEFGLLDIGPFTAKVNLESEDGTVKLVEETTFWVIPWRFAAIAGGAIFFLWTIYFLGGRSAKKKK